VAFNAKGFQMWQVDEDPANFALLDASPVGCTFSKSLQAVSNDLVFLTEQGIRNISIAGASTNLQAGFFGKPIDPLVKDAIASGVEPISLYWPGAGQYWLIFEEEAFVLTMDDAREGMSWSRYVFPAPLDDWTILDDELVVRSGDNIWIMSSEALTDDCDEYGEGGAPIDGYIAWPYLDFGQLGREKQLHGFDLVVDGTVDVSFGYAQADDTLATPPYPVDGDTLSGQIISMPIAGPSFQLRLSFPGEGREEPWEWMAANLYLQDLRGGL
jgi:hypothetical protein